MTNAESLAYINSSEARHFYKRLRRDESNVFNAVFYDRETVNEHDIEHIVKRAAFFFDLPIPSMIKCSDCLAKISFPDFTELGSEIRYDASKLEDIGINNVDAFDALLTHELSHQCLARYHFNFCRCQSWCMELACDFMVGVRCKAGFIATGKYKYAVGHMEVSYTHPEGFFRQKAVEAGFNFAARLKEKGLEVTVKLAIIGLNKFLCEQSKALNMDYVRMLRDLDHPRPKQPELDIMSLPDTNLIKQLVMKIKNKPK